MPSLVDSKRILKGAVGFFVGLGVWLALSGPYNGVVAKPAETILRAMESQPVTRLRPDKTEIIVDREDFPPRSARPGVPLQDLTFNIILVIALFASSRKTFSNRNVVGFLLAGVTLYVTHVLGLVAAVQSIYAVKLGAWSEAAYGPVSRNLWSGASHFYRLVGLYAFGFAAWWIFRPEGIELRARSSSKGEGKRKARRKKR